MVMRIWDGMGGKLSGAGGRTSICSFVSRLGPPLSQRDLARACGDPHPAAWPQRKCRANAWNCRESGPPLPTIPGPALPVCHGGHGVRLRPPRTSTSRWRGGRCQPAVGFPEPVGATWRCRRPSLPVRSCGSARNRRPARATGPPRSTPRPHGGVPGRPAAARDQSGAGLQVRHADRSRQPAARRQRLDHRERRQGGPGQRLPPHQGVNVTPAYGLGQHVRAWFELCKRPEPAVVEADHRSIRRIRCPRPASIRCTRAASSSIITQHRQRRAGDAAPATAPIRGRGPAGAARSPSTASRPFSTARCSPRPSRCARATRRARRAPARSALLQPARAADRPGAGRRHEDHRHQLQPGATIKVWVNGVQAGTGGGARRRAERHGLKQGDTIHVVQDLQGCNGQRRWRSRSPAWIRRSPAIRPRSNLFPVGHAEYSKGGAIKGSVYYPAEDDGEDQPFNKRLAKLGRVADRVHGPRQPLARPTPATSATTTSRTTWRRWASSRSRSTATR